MRINKRFKDKDNDENNPKGTDQSGLNENPDKPENDDNDYGLKQPSFIKMLLFGDIYKRLYITQLELEKHKQAMSSLLILLDDLGTTQQKAVNELSEQVTKMEETLKEHADVIEEASVIKQTNEALKESKDPWVNINGAGFDKEKGIRLELDWNDAFIESLKKEGITAPSEEDMVSLWLAGLSKDWNSLDD